MKAVISSFGSSGDFNPCLAIGRALCQKDADVIFLSNPFYEKKITDAHLRFSPAGEYFDVFQEIQNNPDFLHPRRGPRQVWNLILKTVPDMYFAMKDLINLERPDVIACHLLEYGGMLAAQESGVEYITLSPTPMGWLNTRSPSNMHYTQWPLWGRSLYFKAAILLMNIAFRYSLNPMCKKNGIPQHFDFANDVYANASLNLGLWSQALRPESIGDPPNSKICGFVRDEHIKDWPDVPLQIADLFKLDRRPVVVGLGSTASLHGDQIYQSTVNACKRLDRPCLLIGRDLSKYADLEKNILTVDFAPYGWVFPRAAAVIHHGGLNTTAETLRAGAKSLVVPHGYDQFDNAIRIQQMGTSQRIKLSQVASKKFTTILESILENTQISKAAQAISKQLRTEPEGVLTAAEEIISNLTEKSAHNQL